MGVTGITVLLKAAYCSWKYGYMIKRFNHGNEDSYFEIQTWAEFIAVRLKIGSAPTMWRGGMKTNI